MSSIPPIKNKKGTSNTIDKIKRIQEQIVPILRIVIKNVIFYPHS